MAWDLRLPGQSQEYRGHPSNVGSPSYFSESLGWTPNPATPSLNQRALNVNRNYGDPGITGRPSWGDFDYNRSQGYDRTGPTRGDISPFVSNQANIERANRRGIASLDEDEGFMRDLKKAPKSAWSDVKNMFGSLPIPKTMKMVGDVAKDAARASRLHSSYKDRAVAAGGTKAEGSKAWEADKRAMMTDDEREFEKKYLNLASMADNNKQRDEYLQVAEGAWRNKQTSDRLAAFTGFEDYNPSKYSGIGEGSRYTGDVYEKQGRTGQYVPGVDIMEGLLRKYPRQDYEQGEHWDIAPDRDTRANQNFVDVKNAMEGMSGFDIAPKADEYLGGMYEEEDITSGLGGDDYYEQGEHWDIAPDRLQPHPNPALRFGNLGINDPANEGFIPNIIEQGYTGPSTLIPKHRRKKIGDYTDPDEYLGGMYLDEDEIIPNIIDRIR